jgi:hypothetical protein
VTLREPLSIVLIGLIFVAALAKQQRAFGQSKTRLITRNSLITRRDTRNAASSKDLASFLKRIPLATKNRFHG